MDKFVKSKTRGNKSCEITENQNLSIPTIDGTTILCANRLISV